MTSFISMAFSNSRLLSFDLFSIQFKCFSLARNRSKYVFITVCFSKPHKLNRRSTIFQICRSLQKFSKNISTLHVQGSWGTHKQSTFSCKPLSGNQNLLTNVMASGQEHLTWQILVSSLRASLTKMFYGGPKLLLQLSSVGASSINQMKNLMTTSHIERAPRQTRFQRFV